MSDIDKNLFKGDGIKLKSIIKAIPVGLGIAVNRKILWLNNYFPRISGYPNREVIGKKARIFYPTKTEYDRVGVEFYKSLRLKGRASMEAEWMRPDGRIVDIYLTGSLVDMDGLPKGVAFAAMDITARKIAEKALYEAYAEWQTTFDSIRNPLFLVDNNGVILKYNKAMSDFVNRPSACISGRRCCLLVHGTSKHVRGCPVIRMKKTGRRESLVINAGGRWLNITVDPVFDSEKNIVGAIHSIEDISGRVSQERALEVSEKKYRGIIEATRDGFWYVDIEGRFLDVNRAACRMLGYTRDELLKMKISDIEILEKQKDVVRHIKYMEKSGGDRFETKHRRKDGSIMDVEVSTNFMADGKGCGRVLVFIRDISGRKRAEDAIAASEKKYRNFYESSRDGYALADMNGRLIEYNESYRRMFGYSGRELNEKTYIELTPEKWRRIEANIINEEVMKNGYSMPYEKEYIRKDGSVFPVELVTYLKKDDNGKAVGMWAFVRDITEKKREERVREELIRNLSHELKTPLAILEMSFGMLNKSIEAGDLKKVKSSRKVFLHSVSRLKKDVSNIIDLFSLKTGYMSKDIGQCNFRDVLNNVLQNLEFAMKDKGLKVEVDVGRGVERLYMNKNALRTILFNVMDNAVKFTEKGGIRITSRKTDGHAEIRIRDTGLGVRPEYISSIFEPFSKDHPTIIGAGVGLTICRDIVNVYGGKISISSPGPGRGTSVVVRLPLKRAVGGNE